MYLPPDLCEPLNSWLKVRGSDDGPLFPRVYRIQGKEKMDLSRHMRPESIYRLVRKRSVGAGIEVVTPHDFRRTYATRTLEAGVDVFVLQGAMGHANPATTACYDRRDAKALAKAARALKFYERNSWKRQQERKRWEYNVDCTSSKQYFCSICRL